jgi:hypothetical protein
LKKKTVSVSEAEYHKVAIPYSPIIGQNCGQKGGRGGEFQGYDCGFWALLEWRGDAGRDGRIGNIFFVYILFFLKKNPQFFC